MFVWNRTAKYIIEYFGSSKIISHHYSKYIITNISYFENPTEFHHFPDRWMTLLLCPREWPKAHAPFPIFCVPQIPPKPARRAIPDIREAWDHVKRTQNKRRPPR